MEGNGNLISKIKKNPVLSFFILAFLISWIIWISAPIIAGGGGIFQPEDQRGDRVVFSYISLIGAFGPSLSAILVSAVLDPSPSNASRKKRLIVFTIIFIGCLVGLSIQLFLMNDFSYQVILPSVLLSTIAAYVVSSVYHPKQGVTKLMNGLKQISAKNVWIWIALLLPFTWQIIAAFLDLAFGGTALNNFTLDSLVLLLANYPFALMFGGSLNEEPGWRGFAVPSLQQKFSPLEVGLIVGVIWMHWHFPLHFNGFYPIGIGGFLSRFIYNVPFGVIFTWLYNRSKGNLFACILLHTSVNLASGIFGGTIQLLSYFIMIVFTIIVIFYDKMFKRI